MSERLPLDPSTTLYVNDSDAGRVAYVAVRVDEQFAATFPERRQVCSDPVVYVDYMGDTVVGVAVGV